MSRRLKEGRTRADIDRMRLPHLVVGLAFLLSACGGGITAAEQAADADAVTLAMAASSTTAVVAPSRAAVVAPSTTEVSEPPDASVAGCEQLTDFLIGPDNFRRVDQEVSAAQLVELLESFDSTIAADYAEIVEMQDAAESGLAEFSDVFAAMDEVTNDECGIPVLSAANALVGTMRTTFCQLAGESDDRAGERDGTVCADERVGEPNELPCFVGSGDTAPWPGQAYRAADCDTDQLVLWDVEKGLWSTEEHDAFSTGIASQIRQDTAEALDIIYESWCANVVVGETFAALNEQRWVGDRIVGHSPCGVIGLEPGGATIAWVVECELADWASPLSGESPDIAVAVCGGNYTGIRATDGQVLWQMGTVPAIQARTGPAHFVTVSETFDVVVRDITTGEILWTQRRRDDAKITVGDELLVIGDNGVLQAYDIDSGSTQWVSYGVYASDVVIAGDVVFVRSKDHYLYRFDAASGTFQKATEFSDPEYLERSLITHITDEVVVVQSLGEARHLSIYDARSLDLLWTLDGSYVADYGADSDTLAVTSLEFGPMVTFDLLTGEELRTYPEARQTRPLVRDDLVYYTVWIDTDYSFTIEPAR